MDWCLGIKVLESSFCWLPPPGNGAGRGEFFVVGGDAAGGCLYMRGFDL